MRGPGRHLTAFVATIGLTLLLAACGGSSSDHPRLDLRAQKLIGGSAAQEGAVGQAGRGAGIVKRAADNPRGKARAETIDELLEAAKKRAAAEKRELSPVELRAIYDRPGSVIRLSRVQGTTTAKALPAFITVPLCKNVECTITETTVPTLNGDGISETVALGDIANPNSLGNRSAFVTKHGITLFRQTGSQTILGSVMDHSAFASFVETGKVGSFAPGGEGGFVGYTVRYGAAGGDLTGSRPVKATWQGLMVGHTPAGDDEPVNELLGGSTLAYDAAANTVDVSLTGIKNLTKNRTHAIESITVPGLAVNATGEFAGGTVTEIDGAFYGPAHAEAAGTIYHSGTGAFSGAFGAKRR